jgi:23S rRNA pseudouridine1911/1915/1917 synthase
MKVLYLDNHLLAVEKPAGLLTQPTEISSDSLEEQAKRFLKEKFNKPGAVFLHAIHRLDRPVSGIVLFARTSKALSRLNQLQREQKIQKYYLAFVSGKLKKREDRLVHLLAHGSHRAIVGEGKESVLIYRVLKEEKEGSWLEIELVTGRYHQIRAQLSAIGHPIKGDSRYGGESAPRLMLHHCKMIFHHPVTQEVITLESAFNI